MTFVCTELELFVNSGSLSAAFTETLQVSLSLLSDALTKTVSGGAAPTPRLS